MTTLEKLSKCVKAMNSIQEIIFFAENFNKDFQIDVTFASICEEIEDCINKLWEDYINSLCIIKEMSPYEVLKNEIEHNQMFDTIKICFSDLNYELNISISISFIMKIKEKLKEQDGYVSWGCMTFC